MGAKILVVEDDGGTAETLLNGLRQEGYTVEHVADGRDALYLASSADFDAVILDRMLPGMDGLAVVRALRAADVHTPLIILSALGQLDEFLKPPAAENVFVSLRGRSLRVTSHLYNDDADCDRLIAVLREALG